MTATLAPPDHASLADAHALVAEARSAGVELWSEGGKIRYRAPKGALNAMLSGRLRRAKDAILAALEAPALPPWGSEAREWYEERAGIYEFMGGLTRAEAERLALIALHRRAAVLGSESPATASMIDCNESHRKDAP